MSNSTKKNFFKKIQPDVRMINNLHTSFKIGQINPYHKNKTVILCFWCPHVQIRLG